MRFRIQEQLSIPIFHIYITKNIGVVRTARLWLIKARWKKLAQLDNANM